MIADYTLGEDRQPSSTSSPTPTASPATPLPQDQPPTPVPPRAVPHCLTSARAPLTVVSRKMCFPGDDEHPPPNSASAVPRPAPRDRPPMFLTFPPQLHRSVSEAGVHPAATGRLPQTPTLCAPRRAVAACSHCSLYRRPPPGAERRAQGSAAAHGGRTHLLGLVTHTLLPTAAAGLLPTVAAGLNLFFRTRPVAHLLQNII